MDAKVFYRQNEFETARDITESVGYRSGFARSQTLRDGQAPTEGLSEQAVYVFTPWDINELARDQVIAKFSDRKFRWLKRLDWQDHPILRKRRAIPPPVKPLPPVEPLTLSTAEQDTLSNHHEAATSADDELINPDDFE